MGETIRHDTKIKTLSRLGNVLVKIRCQFKRNANCITRFHFDIQVLRKYTTNISTVE